MIEVKACCLCENHPGNDVFIQAKDYLVSHRIFSVVRCPQCGLVLTNPRPADDKLPAYYQSHDYLSHSGQASTLTEKIYQAVKRLMLRKKVYFLKKWLREGDHILDVGTGTGDFPLQMKKAGIHAIGVEPNEAAAALARAKGLEVYADLSSVHAEGRKSFAMITLWHVLEHMADPNEQIGLIRNLLRHDGMLVVAVPMIDSYDAAYYKQYWAAYDLPRHLVHFSSTTLVQLLNKHGFQLIEKRSLPFDAYYISLLSESHMNVLVKPLAWLRAIYTGLMSNIRYWSGRRPASSQVFVFGPKFAP